MRGKSKVFRRELISGKLSGSKMWLSNQRNISWWCWNKTKLHFRPTVTSGFMLIQSTPYHRDIKKLENLHFTMLFWKIGIGGQKTKTTWIQFHNQFRKMLYLKTIDFLLRSRIQLARLIRKWAWSRYCWLEWTLCNFAASPWEFSSRIGGSWKRSKQK